MYYLEDRLERMCTCSVAASIIYYVCLDVLPGGQTGEYVYKFGCCFYNLLCVSVCITWRTDWRGSVQVRSHLDGSCQLVTVVHPANQTKPIQILYHSHISVTATNSCIRQLARFIGTINFYWKVAKKTLLVYWVYLSLQSICAQPIRSYNHLMKVQC